MSGRIGISFCVVLLAHALSLGAWANETCGLTIKDERLSPGRQTELILSAPVSLLPEAPEIPFISGLTIRFKETVREPLVGDSETVLHIYRVIPLQIGVFQVGPFTFSVPGGTCVTGGVVLSVTEQGPEQTLPPSGREDDLSGHTYLECSLGKRSFFVNERIPVTLSLYSDWLDLAEIVVSPLKGRSCITTDFMQGSSRFVTRDGIRYAVIDYTASFFVPHEGETLLEPLRVDLKVMARKAGCELLNDNERFYERFLQGRSFRALSLQIAPGTVSVRPLPADRPDGFSGAVGSFTLLSRAEPVDIETGGVVTVTLTVGGEGNFGTVTCPAPPDTEGIMWYDPRIIPSERGLVYERQVKIQEPSVRALPGFSLVFFDPAAQIYRSVRTDPVPVHVSGGGLPRMPASSADEDRVALPLQPDRPGTLPLHDRTGTSVDPRVPFSLPPAALLLFWLQPFLVAAAFGIRKRLSFIRTDQSYLRRKQARRVIGTAFARARRVLALGRVDDFYDELFFFVRAYIGARTGVSPEGMTEESAARLLREGGALEETIRQVSSIFSALYEARYARTTDGNGMPEARRMCAVTEQLIALLEKTDLRVNV